MEESSDSPIAADLPGIHFLPSYFKGKPFIAFSNVCNHLKLDFTDCNLLVLLTAIGISMHVFRIQYPRHAFPNEEFALPRVNSYLTGHYYYPDEPPFAYQLQALVGYFLTYDGKTTVSTRGFSSLYYTSLRITSAFLSGLTAPLFYLLLRSLGSGPAFSAIGACVVVTDLMLIASGREIGRYGIFQFLIVSSLFLITLYDRYTSVTFLMIEAVVIGLTVVTHYRAVVLLAIAVIQQLRSPGFAGRILILLAVAFVIWFATFAVHLTVLPFATANEYAPACVLQALLPDSAPNWEARLEFPSLFVRVFALAFSRPGEQRAYAPFAWWRWPLALAKCEVLYDQDHRKIVYFGNPFVWLPVVAAVGATAAQAAATLNAGRVEAVLALGYFLGLAVPGPPPDYCLSLFFGIALLVRWLERLPLVFRGFAASVAVGAALFGFYLWSPLAYGFYVADFDFLQWGQRWL
jgi:dolichyl-phosphate-mannose--protein O-mannosyl transferase